MTAGPITKTELESYLWGAATLLRGYIDAGDYKQFIFPLLFHKRLCDVYDEEVAAALEESEGDAEYAELPEQHRFQIPTGAHWKATRTKVKDEVREKGNSLSIPLYVRQKNGNGAASRGNAIQEETSLREVIERWQESSATLRLSMDQLFTTLNKMKKSN